MTDEKLPVPDLKALKETDLLFRKEETEKIVFGLRNGLHTYVYGPVGLGKTSALKEAIESFNGSRSRGIYVDCSTCKTERSVLKELLNALNEAFGTSLVLELRANADIVSRLKGEIGKLPQLKAIVLDHIDAIEERDVADNLLKLKLTMILVSDDVKAVRKFSPLVQSSFTNTIGFPDYSPDQLMKILTLKAKRFFGQGFYKDSLLTKIGKLCNGNIAYAESMLVSSYMRAFQLGKNFVDDNDVPMISIDEDLSEDEHLIVNVLKELSHMPGGKLYDAYRDRSPYPKAERTFRDYMRDLCRKKIVRAVGTNRGRVYEIVEK